MTRVGFFYIPGIILFMTAGFIAGFIIRDSTVGLLLAIVGYFCGKLVMKALCWLSGGAEGGEP